MKIVITYRHSGKNEYLPLIDLAFKSAKKFGYETVLVGTDGIAESDHYLPTPKGIVHPLCEWILMAQELFLKSELFNENSVIFSPDTLIMKPLDDIFKRSFDWAVTEREYSKDKINNGVMFVKHSAKEKLLLCWESMRQIASKYDRKLQDWYADQRAVNEICEKTGDKPCGLRVLRLPCKMYNATPERDKDNALMLDNAYILHFKGLKKDLMEQYAAA